MDDRTAILRLKQGDASGLAALVERYQVEAARAAFLITQDRQSADDVVQEAFVRVYRHAARIDEKRPFAPYLMRIVANLAIDSVKRRQREGPIEDDLIYEFAQDDETPPEQAVEKAEMREAVRQALITLPPAQRAAVVLRYYFDYSEREVAEALSLPRGTVSWRLSSARKQLGALLQVFGQKGTS